MQQRIEQVQRKLQDTGLDGILVTTPENRRYLSGFTGTSGFVLITREEGYLITDFRYVEQAREQAPYLEIVQHGQDFYGDLAKLLQELEVRTLAFEEEHVTYRQYRKLRDKLDVALEPVREWIEQLRLVKSEAEIARLKKAVKIADEGFSHIVGYIAVGKTELDISLELEFYMRKQGASGAAFDIIIASGPRGALPHGVASDKTIQKGELVVMDFGAVYAGYHSDITRTVNIGRLGEKQREIYDIVLEAQQAAIEAVKPGVTGAEVDQVARDIIKDKGYGDNFGHGLGHGVGLAIHEGPRLAPGADTVLKPGMVVTVEPGIYIPGWGGVRIEDIVLVTGDGCEVLTASTKELLVL
ncbi:MAG: aminopeptidase P family protein [Thermoanaerobacteraceae bacterium]|nr:aminopeptidase P family protein [Thermoanaerobacteraceae bacterium]